MYVGKYREMVLGFVLFVLLYATGSSANDKSNHTSNNSDHEEVPLSLKVAQFDFHHVSAPITIMLWILIASLGKLGFHLSHKLSSVVPESCLVILLGVVIGGIMEGMGVADKVPNFSSKVFFLFMLPPIVLEAGYFLQDRAFFDNLGTILLYAVVGTIFNTFTVGFSLFGVSNKMGINLSLMHALTFASLIAAVDPVAVLAVFEEIHVNVMLYILVFGESLLNDAVTIVLYHLFESLSLFDEITHKEILIGVAQFFVVSLGGTFTGLLWGLATSFVTKYTDHVRVIEPIFVFVMSYLSYLMAEMFHFSGIMSIVTCAIIMKPYVEQNISRKSHTTIKYFLKMLSSSSETLIFMFLGVRLVSKDHVWHTKFVLVTLVFIIIFRSIGVIILTFLANTFGRLNKLSAVDQFIMCYGGIRGAVAFSLAILLAEEHFHLKKMFVTTTIVVVMFTVFFQGITIKPLVRILHVKLSSKEDASMCAELNEKFLDHLVAGMEEISGQRGNGYYWQLVEHFHTHYLRRWLIRDADVSIHDEDILLAYRRLAYKDALTHLEREGSGTVLFESPKGISLQLLARSAYEAAAVTSVEPSDEEGDTQPMLRAGDNVRVPDAIQRDWRAADVPSEGDLEIHYHGHNDFSTLVARNRKTFRHRKFQRNNLLDDDDAFTEKSYLMPLYPRVAPYSKQLAVDSKPRPHKHRPHHHKRHKHKRHPEEPPKKKLSTIFEDTRGKNGRASPTFNEAVGAIPSSDDDGDHGIMFDVSPHGRIGRYPSTESSEIDNLESDADPNHKASDEDDGGKRSKGDSSRQQENIPMDSIVVNIEGSPASGTKQDQNMESAI